MGGERVDEAAGKLIKVARTIEEGGAGRPIALGVITAAGDKAYRRADDVLVIPICALRE